MIRRLTVMFLLGASAAATSLAQIEVDSASFVKSGTFIQSSNDVVSSTNSWILFISITPVHNAEFVRITQPFESQLFKVAGQNRWEWFSAFTPTRGDLDAAYPDLWTYTFDVTYGSLEYNAYFGPRGPKIPDAPPRFLNGAFDALQNANPNQPITLSLDAFTIPATAARGETRLDIRDMDQNVFVYSAVNSSTQAAEFTIPAGTLRPGTPYYAQATRAGFSDTLEMPYFIYHRHAAGELRTQLSFMTRTCIADINLDGAIDLNDFFAFFNCWDASTPCADLDGNPGVDLGDFFAFFNAFDASC